MLQPPKGGIVCLPRLLLQWRELHMKPGGDPGSPWENAGAGPFSGPAYMQLMRLLQDLPKLQKERQICPCTRLTVYYLLWELIKAKGQSLLPSSF
jgi:hypothetical protein